MKRLFAIEFLCGFLIPCANGEAIAYPNIGMYQCDLLMGVPHRRGTFKYVNGDKYVGEFKNAELPYGSSISNNTT